MLLEEGQRNNPTEMFENRDVVEVGFRHTWVPMEMAQGIWLPSPACGPQSTDMWGGMTVNRTGTMS